MVTMSYKGYPFQPNWGGPENQPSQEPSRWNILSRPRSWCPPTDVYETEDAVVIRVEIAGMQEGDFSITLEDRSLAIRGIRPDELLEKRAYLQMEIPFGEFRTDIELPCEVEIQDIVANYQDGFLRVYLPKAHPGNAIAGEQ